MAHDLPAVATVRRWLVVLAMLLGLGAQSQPAPPRIQVFLQVEGTSPDWSKVNLTVSRIEAGGIDPVTGRRFSVTAFQGSANVSVPRSAIGVPRLLGSGEIRAGNLDRVSVFLSGTLERAADGGSALGFPIAVEDKALSLRPAAPIPVSAGATLSLVAVLRLSDGVFTRGGTLTFKPKLTATTFIPGPANFANGNERVDAGPDTTFPELGVLVSRAKLVDLDTGAVRDLTLRPSTGTPVIFESLRTQDDALWRQAHGALTPEIVQQLESPADGGLVLADVWMRVPGEPTLLTDAGTPQQWRDAHSAFVAARHAAAAPIAAQVTAALADAGATIVETELNPPVLHIEASRSVLEDVAARSSQVVAVSKTPTERSVQATRGAADLLQQPLQDAAELAGAGGDVLIALTEDLACVNTQHEALTSVVFDAPVNSCGSSLGTGANGGHSTAVAGALVGAYPSGTGTIRPPPGKVGLLPAHVFTAGGVCEYASDTVLSRSPHIITNSCVSGPVNTPNVVDYGDQYSYDYAVYADRIFVASGAGNLEVGQSWADFPVMCTSFNAVCVGGYSHNQTTGLSNHADDVPLGRSRNDPATNREEPDLVGPGSGFYPHWSNNNQYVSAGGTSFSTPMIAGTAALLLANFPQHLLNDPTLTRAVLMASASHSFQGLARVPNYSDSVDERTGAGAVRGDRAKAILEQQQFFTRYIDRATDFDAAGYFTTPVSFSAAQGDRVRIVLTYDQCPIYDSSAIHDTLRADLDLVANEETLDGPIFVHANNSHVDNNEVLEFDLPQGAEIHLRLRAQFWSPCADGSRKTHLAIAWDRLEVGDLPPAGP